MLETDSDTPSKRTAVLVVHGIGSQRAQETVRGIIRAVWFDDDSDEDNTGRKKFWTHPEASGDDIDLVVMTTNRVPGSADGRNVDFHELYWAHLMSETKAVAVLLWLFELARKGPTLKLGMNGLWWCGAIFLCLLLLSMSLLAFQGVALFSLTAVASFSHIDQSGVQTLLIAPLLIVFSGIAFGLYVSWRHRAYRLTALLSKYLLYSGIIVAICLALEWVSSEKLGLVTGVALPILAAFLATSLLMKKPGRRAFWRVLAVSAVVFALFLVWSWASWSEGSKWTFAAILAEGWRPWSLTSTWSSVVAWVIIGVYLIVNAVFLQPYLGDAARYFRNSPGNVAVRRDIRRLAIETLANLHESGLYDRIIVVAHSLGCVVSYDMLRAYFSQVCDRLPPVAELGPDVDDVDRAAWQPYKEATDEERKESRTMTRKIVAAIATAAEETPAGQNKPKTWLVTDFVTLGNALTHAEYLMCEGEDRAALANDFQRHVRERDFPTCPPIQLDQDGLLTFENPRTGQREFHHGAVFGLTRWTNLYFPMEQIFWGDAIGGPVGRMFGSHVVDIEISTNESGAADFFTHNTYWDIKPPRVRKDPHIQALREAVNLADK